MTTKAPPPTPAPPAPAIPYVPAWALYVYEERAFLTWDGRLVATAAVATPAQGERIDNVFHRLAHGRAARRSAPAEHLALDRRQRPAV